jgi:hypothetical protein
MEASGENCETNKALVLTLVDKVGRAVHTSYIGVLDVLAVLVFTLELTLAISCFFIVTVMKPLSAGLQGDTIT